MIMFCAVTRDLNNSPFSPTNQVEDDFYNELIHCPVCDNIYNMDDNYASEDEKCNSNITEKICSDVCREVLKERELENL